MKKLITVRQLIFILMISVLTLKVLSLPSLLAKDFGRDSYIFVLIFLLFDFVVLLLFLYLFNKFPNLTFYELIFKIFGKVLSKIIMFILFVFFFAKCWAVFQSNYNYLNQNLYTKLNWLVFSLPILVTVLYISKFGVNAAARLTEVAVPIVISGFILSLFVGLFRADFTSLLPVLEKGFLSKFGGALKYSFWFGDYIIFIVFFGNVKKEKHQNKKIIFSILATILILSFFMAVVYAVFKYSTICHSNSISDILQVMPTASDIGNFDWILILIWDIALFLYFTFNSLGAFYCFRQTFFKKNQLLSICIILTLILVLSMLSNFDINRGILIVQQYLSYFCLFAQYLLPLIIFVFSFNLKRSKKNVKIFMEK